MTKPDFRDDRGVVAVLFSVFLGFGLLLGVVSIAVDVGQIYQERRALQNAAEAAAWAEGVTCATRAIGCPDNATVAADGSTLQTRYANTNSPDGQTKVLEVCLPNNGGCSTTTGVAPVLNCATPNPQYKVVRVYTQTLTKSGGNAITNFFADLMSPARSTGSTLVACAQAKWGTASSAPVFFPYAISVCQFKFDTDLLVHSVSSVTGNELTREPCRDADGNEYVDSPSGMVKLNGPGGNNADAGGCTPANAMVLTVGQTVATNGDSMQDLCGLTRDADILDPTKLGLVGLLGRDLVIPVLSHYTGSTAVVEAFVSFRYTGFYFKNGGYPTGVTSPYTFSDARNFWGNPPPALQPAVPCQSGALDYGGLHYNGGPFCFFGRFNADVTYGDSGDGSSRFGVSSVRLIP